MKLAAINYSESDDDENSNKKMICSVEKEPMLLVDFIVYGS